MGDAGRYHESADYCEGMGAKMPDGSELQASYLDLARMWRRLADDCEKHERQMNARIGPAQGTVIVPFREEL